MNKSLAWKLSKIIQSEDPSVALIQMPGGSGMKIFLTKMESLGASKELVDLAREAIKEYEHLIDAHAGDRATLEMLGGELDETGRHLRDEQFRKQAFQGNCYIWGAKARVFANIAFVGPCATPEHLDYVVISSFVDFRCIRDDVTWPVAIRGIRGPSADDAHYVTEALDPSLRETDDPPFLAEFCSQPLPKVRKRVSGKLDCYELVEGQVGNTGSRTCTFGTIIHGVPFRPVDTDRPYASYSTCSDTPVEQLITDIYIHEGFDFAIPPSPRLMSCMSVLFRNDLRELPFSEGMQSLGTDPRMVVTPEVPNYRPMVEKAFEYTGWDPQQFHGYRIKMSYPPCPTKIQYRCKPPMRDAW